MGNNKTSLEDVKKDIQGWADSEILDNNKKIIIIGGKNITKTPNPAKIWGVEVLCGGSTPQ